MNALFRCDATHETGFGHLSRCIALAEALRLSNTNSIFVGKFDQAACDQLAASGFGSVNLPVPVNTDTSPRELAETLASHGADFIVLDSYRADERYLYDLASLGPSIVAIDDFRALSDYPCDVVLNFTWEAPSLDYPEGPVLLLGPQFLLARRNLVEHRARSIERDRRGPVRNLLIAIGGTDPKGIATRLIRILHELHSGLCVRVIAQSTCEIAAMMERFSPDSLVLPRQPDLSEQLMWADAAITGGGLIKYESAYMAAPAAAISQNEGQDGETQVLSRAGLVFDLGLADSVSDNELANALDRFISNAEMRSTMTSRMRETFVSDPTANAANAILEAVRR
ncbi:MAG: hypothetical protein AAF494_13010 [Pseudomonadota bacterium]